MTALSGAGGGAGRAGGAGGSSRFLPRLFARVSVRAAIILICVAWSLPTAGLLISSLRHENAIRATGWWDALLHPFEASAQWTLANYETVFASNGMAGAFINSLVVTIPATVIPITMAAFAAYAFAWMRFPGKSVLFAIVVGLLVVPLQMSLVPVLRMYAALDLNGTFLGVWLAHTGFGLPLAIFLLYNYISQLPGDLFESASIDGASHFQIFRTIVVPLSVPALASFAIFQFLWVWNDLLVALIYLGTTEEVSVLSTALNEIVGSRGEAWHLLTAGAFVTMIVPLAVFLGLQRFFVRGIVAGSVKG
jgi:alpha-glucoside transport system permease protein